MALLGSADETLKYLSPQEIGKQTIVIHNVISGLMGKCVRFLGRTEKFISAPSRCGLWLVNFHKEGGTRIETSE